jgi:hypothetical protein
MIRPLLVLLVALLCAGRALAFSAEGATAEVVAFGGKSGLSLGVFGIDTAKDGLAEELPFRLRVATAGLTFAHSGWSVGVSAGQMQCGIPRLFEETLQLAAVAVGREMMNVAGGTLSAELRASRLFAGDGTATDVYGASLRWALKF